MAKFINSLKKIWLVVSPWVYFRVPVLVFIFVYTLHRKGFYHKWAQLLTATAQLYYSTRHVCHLPSLIIFASENITFHSLRANVP